LFTLDGKAVACLQCLEIQLQAIFCWQIMDSAHLRLAPVLAGVDKETAQKEYIALVKELAEKYAK
jgi:hypothetical protein